jgi:hypothetical protein
MTMTMTRMLHVRFSFQKMTSLVDRKTPFSNFVTIPRSNKIEDLLLLNCPFYWVMG